MMESGNRIFLDGDASELAFSFAFNDDENTLIKHEARVQFQRTLRVPDDGVEYPLPAGLGSFPLLHSRSEKLDLPAHMKSRGGVVFPIYPFEAAWMNFYCESMFPIALRIAAGKINAVTGDDWSESTPEIQDYVVLPDQYWLDGFNTGDGQVRQFVAAKLGANLTVEEQVTARAEWGGIQILAIPMKSERYIELLQNHDGALGGAVMCMSEAPECMSLEMDMSMDMGMGQGGTIRQTIEDDPYGIDAWDFEKAQRVFVSMIDARAWPKVGGETIPTPVTSEQYEKEGIPWFSLEGFSDVPKSEKLSKLKSVQAGMVELGVEVDTISPKVTPQRQVGRGVADGFW